VLPERRAETEKAIAAHGKALSSRIALKKLQILFFREDGCFQKAASLFYGRRPFRICLFNPDDFLGGQPFRSYFHVSWLISIKSQMEYGIETEEIFRSLTAKTGNRRQLVHIGTQGHGLQIHLDAPLQQQGQTTAESGV
jgi:hypothetical protein